MGGTPHLSDLRKTREHVPFDDVDDQGNPVHIDVWVVKVNDDDQMACVKAGDAAKARTLIDRRDHDSETWQAMYGLVYDQLGDDKLAIIELLVADHIAERGDVIAAEVAGTEGSKWEKDSYLEGLLTAWVGVDGDPGYLEAWTAKDDDPETLDPALAARIPEAIRIMAELEEYNAQIQERIEAERGRFIRDHKDLDIETLRLKLVDFFLNQQATAAWNRAFERSRIFYATRKFDNPRERYFESPAHVRETDSAFVNKLIQTYRDMSVEGIPGKSSPGPQSSSPGSGSSGAEETSEASGPTAASV